MRNNIHRQNRIIATTVFVSVFLFIIAVIAYYADRQFYSFPTKRLALNEVYPSMPEDSFHHYINLPIDHDEPQKGLFRDFYLLSPSFFKNKNITFLLTDGQMELVSPDSDFDFFESVLPNNSYVLVGVRGHSPTVFPEVYKNGQIDYAAATHLFNSDQQVEDIEAVRLDLIKKGYLSEKSKINLFGASGAGVLAQQYLSKYHQHVNRVILESTGAPDIARDLQIRYSPNFKSFNPKGYAIFDSLMKKKAIDKKRMCNILYQKGRTEPQPIAAQLDILNRAAQGNRLWSYQFTPITNLSLLDYMIKAPTEIAARIRWFELVGYDLMSYNNKKETNLLYEISEKTISDVLEYHKIGKIPAKEFSLKRKPFTGEVLLLKGTEDVVFSDTINIHIQKAYRNAELLFFKDGHRMQNNKDFYQKIRNTFLNEGLKSDVFLNLIHDSALPTRVVELVNSED